MALTGKKIISILLVCVPVILLIWQQITGVFKFRSGTPDATIFTLLCGVSIVAGFAYQQKTPRKMFRTAILAAALFIGLPFLVGGVFAMGDAALGSDIAGGKGFYFALDSISSQITEWTVVLDFIVGMIPAGVVVAGIILIYLSDNPDEMQTPVLETIVVIAVMIAATLGMGWLGVDIW